LFKAKINFSNGNSASISSYFEVATVWILSLTILPNKRLFG